jgi:hypothetical protein
MAYVPPHKRGASQPSTPTPTNGRVGGTIDPRVRFPRATKGTIGGCLKPYQTLTLRPQDRNEWRRGLDSHTNKRSLSPESHTERPSNDRKWRGFDSHAQKRNLSPQYLGSHIERMFTSTKWPCNWPALKRNNWAVGVIAFIPYHEDRAPPMRCFQHSCGQGHGHDLEPQGREHPCVILQKTTRMAGDKELMLDIVMTTSNPQPYRYGEKSRSFPLQGCYDPELPPNPEKYCSEHTMYVAGAPSKQSYVLSNHIYRVPFSEIRCWYDSQDRLTETSYKRLMSLVGREAVAVWSAFTPAIDRK